MIEYKKIYITHKQDLKKLIEDVLNKLERKEFFIPFTEDEIDGMRRKL